MKSSVNEVVGTITDQISHLSDMFSAVRVNQEQSFSVF